MSELNEYELAARMQQADIEHQKQPRIDQKAIREIETRLHRINRLEDKLQSLYLVFQATNDFETLRQTTEKYNHLNLVYAQLNGKGISTKMKRNIRIIKTLEAKLDALHEIIETPLTLDVSTYKAAESDYDTLQLLYKAKTRQTYIPK